MKENTLKITTGAMFIAIFAIILLLNRQTGGFFEEFVFYILPIPMVAYSAKYGWKTSIPVLIAMSLISIIFGTITTIFYAVTEAFIGMVLGSCINKKIDMTKTLFVVMILSVVMLVLNVIVLGELFGYNLIEELSASREMFFDLVSKAENMGIIIEKEQVDQLKLMLNTDALMRMMIIGVIAVGALQGFLIFQISLLLLNRLKFSIPKPKSVFDYYPQRWISYSAIVLFIAYFLGYKVIVDNLKMAMILQTVGMCGFLYLAFFGFIGVVLWLRVRLKLPGFISTILAILCFFSLPMLELIVGVLYTTGDWHANMVLEDAFNRKKREQDFRRNAPTMVDASGRYSYTFRKDGESSGDGESQVIEKMPAEGSHEVDAYRSYEAKGQGGNRGRSNASAGNRAAAANRGPKRTSIAQAAHMRTIKDEEEE